MKITTILLLAAIMHVSAATYCQTVTLSEKNVPLEQVLKKIKQQTGFDILYHDQVLSGSKKVNIELKRMPLADALDQLLKNQDLAYIISDRTVIIIKKKGPSFPRRVATTIPAITVRGRVLDETGEPLPSASIQIKGKHAFFTSNENGDFNIPKVQENGILVIKYLGYKTREIPVRERLGSIVMEISESKLDEVKIIAYGSTTERLRTGAVNTVKAATIERQPVGDVLLALQGQVPGLYISQGTALPGARVEFNIRGLTSLNAQAIFDAMQDPLVVIDGVPFSTDFISPGNQASVVGTRFQFWDKNNYQANGGFSALSAINPADIERIDVLKDADATAIYGSKGANGVILITTKRAMAGKPSLNINFSQGLGKVSRKLEMLTTRQYLDMRYEAFANDGRDWRDPNVAAPDLKLWDTTRYTDWQKELVGRTAKYTMANVSYLGGTQQNSFRISTNYMKHGSVFGDQFKDEKFSGGISYNHASTNNRLKFDVVALYTYDDIFQPNTNPWVAAISLPPNAPRLYNDDGSLNWEQGTFNNPIADLLETQQLKSKNININGRISYRFTKNLTLKAEAGYTDVNRDMTSLIPLTSYNPFGNININTALRSGRYTRNYGYSTNLNSQANYVAKLGPGNLDALLALQLTRQGNEEHRIGAFDFQSDEIMHNYEAAALISIDPVRSFDYRYVGLIARLGYNISNRYFFTLNGNRDGSSRFGPEKRFGNFGSAATAWIFSEESAIKKALPFLSFGKLRFSYGISGSDNIGDYNYLSFYAPAPNQVTYRPPFPRLQPLSLFNPDYAWEKTRKADVELNLGFLNDRIMVKANYYNNRTSNQLIGESLPMTTGFRTVAGNGPDATVQNAGLELQLNTEIVQSKNFSWSSNFNFSLNRNKLISFPNLEGSAFARFFRIGSSIRSQRAYNHVGVNPHTGLNLYRLQSGKDTSATTSSGLGGGFAEQYLFIDLTPGFNGGWNNSFQYKGWSLSLIMQVVKSLRVDNITMEPSIPGLMANISQHVFDNSWRKPGDHALYQRFTTSNATEVYGSRAFSGTEQFYRNVWYVSLNNLSLSYALPGPLLKKLRLSSCRLYVNGQNLFTVSNLKAHDPTTSGENSLPRLRIVTTGVNFNF